MIFPGSAAVAQVPVKHLVVGSNPTRGAKKLDTNSDFARARFSLLKGKENFFAGWRVVASGGGLVHFRFRFLDLCIRFGKIISKVCEGFNSGALRQAQCKHFRRWLFILKLKSESDLIILMKEKQKIFSLFLLRLY